MVVPGRLDRRSGGSLYDAQAVAALGRRGTAVRVHELAGRFPDADDLACRAVTQALAAVGADGVAVIDGLCLSALAAVDGAGGPGAAPADPGPRRVALMHHPAALETGLSAGLGARLAAAERAALATCRHVVTTSALTARQMVADYGVGADRISIVLPGVARAPLAAPRRGAAPRLMTVGAVIPRKGHDVLVAALAQIADVAWHCDIYGSVQRDAATASQLRWHIHRRGLARRVRLRGEVDGGALWRGYARADVFVLATHYEGYGMVFGEALARGLPIVACAGGAVAEAVGDAGLLAAPGDVGGLARHLRTILGDGARRRRLAARAQRARGRQRSWDDVAAGFADALARV